MMFRSKQSGWRRGSELAEQIELKMASLRLRVMRPPEAQQKGANDGEEGVDLSSVRHPGE